jgi:hypothetical protein
MGNIGNFNISRVGINQFWQKHWFSDKFFKVNLHQDNIIKHFIKFFFNYGLIFDKYLFYNNFWFKNNNLKKKTSYFRKYNYSNSILNIEHSFKLRLGSGEYFPLKLWIIKYSNWVIISYLWFKPVKNKILINNKVFNKNPLILSKFNALDIRYKLLLYYFFKKLKLKQNNYLF